MSTQERELKSLSHFMGGGLKENITTDLLTLSTQSCNVNTASFPPPVFLLLSFHSVKAGQSSVPVCVRKYKRAERQH